LQPNALTIILIAIFSVLSVNELAQKKIDDKMEEFELENESIDLLAGGRVK